MNWIARTVVAMAVAAAAAVAVWMLSGNPSAALSTGFAVLAWLLVLALRRQEIETRSLAQTIRALEPGGTLEVPRTPAHPALRDVADAVARLLGRAREGRDSAAAEAAGLRRLLDRLPAGVLVLAPDGTVSLVNETLKTWGLVAPTETPAALDAAVVHPDLRAELQATLETPGPRAARVTGFGPDPRSFFLSVRPLDDGSGNLLAVVEDVTRADALESVRQEFIANVTHELRTPLSSIRALAETLLDEDGVDPDLWKAYLRRIHRQVARMTELVSDLTQLSMIESGAVELRKSRVRLRPLVDECVEQLRPRYADKGLDVRVELPDDLEVEADPKRLEQILVNLLDNAMKFNRNQGSVEIRASRNDGFVEIVVEDTGPGISSEDREKIFRRFFQVEGGRAAHRQGTGLGLAIVKHLVRLHGGEVSVDSELGRGTRMRVRLPAPGVSPG